jgi:ATP-dependent RNA helicase DDX21
MTLRLIRTEDLPRAVSARMVMGVLSDIWQVAADNVGKIRIIDDPKVQGAVFDLPAEIAKELLTKPMRAEDIVDSIKKVSFRSTEFCTLKVQI